MIILEGSYDYCPHSDCIDDKGIIICRRCGLIIDSNNFVVQNKRAYSNEEIIKTTQYNLKDDFFSRRTIFKPKDATISTVDVRKFARMDKIDNWATERKNIKSNEVKNKIKTYLEPNKMSDNKNIKKRMNYILNKVGDYSIQGKSMNIFAAALLIYIIRTSRVPCNIKNIMEFYSIKKKMSVFNMLTDIIKKYNLPEMIDIRLRDFVSWYLHRLNIDDLMVPEDVTLLQNNGIYYADLMEEHSIGKSNLCNVSGILYHVFKNNGIRITQEDVANCIGVTTASLRRAVKELKELVTLYDNDI